MTYEFGSFRFGLDTPSRIATSTVFFQEQAALLPGEPRYQPLAFVSGDDVAASPIGGTTEDGHPIWSSVPSRCDLMVYQGDDVVIPLYFNDPDITGDNYDLNYDWTAQIRLRHNYTSSLVADMSVVAEYHPAAGGTDLPDVDDEYTLVEMYLPRAFNTRWGLFEWEIAAYRTMDLSRFPPPPGWDADTAWPPPKALKTWLYGRCYVLPRTTTTDTLPAPTPGVVTLGPRGFVVAGNGMLSTGANPSVGIDIYGRHDAVPEGVSW